MVTDSQQLCAALDLLQRAREQTEYDQHNGYVECLTCGAYWPNSGPPDHAAECWLAEIDTLLGNNNQPACACGNAPCPQPCGPNCNFPYTDNSGRFFGTERKEARKAE